MGEIARRNIDGWGNALILYADETGTSTSGNYSSVHTYLNLYVVPGGSVASSNIRVNTTGGQESNLGYRSFGSGTHRLKDGYYNAPHDSNGYGSTTVEGYFNSAIGNWSLSGTLTLTKINRYAQMTNAIGDFNDEDDPWFEFTNPGNATNLNCWLEVNPTGEHLCTRNLSITSGRYTWELTETERNQLRAKLPKGVTGKIRIGLYSTQGGSTGASYIDRNFSLINYNPVFTDFDVEDINTTTVALTGSTKNNVININGYSNIQATIPVEDMAEAQKEASMVKYQFSIGDSSTDITYSDEEDVSGNIPLASNGTYKVYAIDSRQKSTLVTKTASSTIDYSKVYLDALNCKVVRNDNQVGENAILMLQGTFWNNNFGVVTNSIKSITYRLKKSDSSTWIPGTTTITPTISGNTVTVSQQIASDNQDTTWDLDKVYDVEITMTDELSTTTIYLVLNSAIPTMSLDKNGVGIMCAYDSSLGGKLQVGGKVIDENIYSTDEIKTNKVWKNGEIIYRKVYSLNNWPNNGTTTINHGISNLKKITKIEYTWYDTDDQRWFYGLRNDATDVYIKIGSISSTTIYCIGRGTDWSRRTRDVDIVIEYTKTTD